MKFARVYPMFELMKVRDKLGEDIPLKLWPEQVNYFENYLYKKRRVIDLKARQKGFTLLHGLDSLLQGADRPFRTIVLSKGKTESQEFLDKIKKTFYTMDEKLRYELGYTDKSFRSDFIVCHKTKSEIISLPVTGGRSFQCDRLISDESAFVKKIYNGKINLKELIGAAEPSIEKWGGQLILMSTADGPDYFKKLYFDAKRGLNSYTAYFFPCFADPTFTVLDREIYEKNNGTNLANQEYPRTDKEAFLASGRPVFDVIAIEYYFSVKPDFIRATMTSPLNIVSDHRGCMRFIQKYKQEGQYLIASDVAEGLEDGDYTCAIVFDRQTKEIVSFWHGEIDFAEWGSVLAMLGRHYNNAIIAVEAGVSAHGTTALMHLKDVEKYPSQLIHQSSHSKPRSDDKFLKPMRRYGWITNKITKQLIIDNLASIIIQRAMPYIPEEIISELEAYVRDDTGKTNAESGFNDDLVMALAIGLYLLPKYPYEKHAKDSTCDNCAHRSFNKELNVAECLATKKLLYNGPVWCPLWRFKKFIPHNDLQKSAKKTTVIT